MLGPPECRRLRVLTLVATLNPGGAERLAATVASRLDRDRFESVLCTTRGHGQSILVDQALAAGVRLLALQRSSRAALWAWLPLIAFLRREQVDVLHAHMFGSNVWAAVVGRIARVPVVIAHEHSWSFKGEPVRRFLDRELISRGADVLLAVSKEDRRRMIEVEGIRRDKIRILPNGIPPLPPPRGAVRSELGIPPSSPVIGTLTVLRREKALHVLVQASALLAPEFPDLRVLIAGQGPEEESLRALVRELGLEEVVLLLGFRRDVADVLAALDVAVFSSEREGSPLAVMESMAAGKPVVATCVGGVPELVDDGVHGLLVRPRDPHALSKAVAILLRDPGLRTELGRRGQARQERDFHIEATVRRLEDLYQQLFLTTERARQERMRPGALPDRTG
jgi:glycosyltransferase involved in cell wall biosynthesis